MKAEQIARKLGKRIREERSKTGLSQVDLAIQAGLSANYVSEIERGVRDVKVSTVGRISQVLQIPPSTLFS